MNACRSAPRRPRLRLVPLRLVWPPRPGRCYMTMSPRQWDGLLQEAYALGYVLVEVNKHDRVLGAYCLNAPDPEVN